MNAVDLSPLTPANTKYKNSRFKRDVAPSPTRLVDNYEPMVGIAWGSRARLPAISAGQSSLVALGSGVVLPSPQATSRRPSDTSSTAPSQSSSNSSCPSAFSSMLISPAPAIVPRLGKKPALIVGQSASTLSLFSRSSKSNNLSSADIVSALLSEPAPVIASHNKKDRFASLGNKLSQLSKACLRSA